MENPISQRIKFIMDRECDGKVVEFANQLNGIPYQVISRLYKKDPRNGKYPTPSTDLLLEIINKFTYYNPRWLLTGYGDEFLDDSEDLDQTNDREISPQELTDYWRSEYIEVVKKYQKLQEEHSLLLKNKIIELLSK